MWSLVKHVLVDTSVLALHRCYYVFVLPILELRTPVLGSTLDSQLRPLACLVHLARSIAMTKVHCGWVFVFPLMDFVWGTRFIRTGINACSVSCHNLLPEFDTAEQPSLSKHYNSSCRGIWCWCWCCFDVVLLLKLFPACPSSYVWCPSLHTIWHWNVELLERCS